MKAGVVVRKATRGVLACVFCAASRQSLFLTLGSALHLTLELTQISLLVVLLGHTFLSELLQVEQPASSFGPEPVSPAAAAGSGAKAAHA